MVVKSLHKVTVGIFSDLARKRTRSIVMSASSGTEDSALKEAAKELPPPLSEDKHKGQAGRIAIIGGSSEYTGAPYYAGVSALKNGADLAYIFCMKDAAVPLKSYTPELIVLPYLDGEHGRSLTISRLLNAHAIVIGPGLGENVQVHATVTAIVKYLKESKMSLSKIPLIFDADGIGLVADNRDLLRDYAGSVYLTPNANEIKKLSNAFLGKRDMDVKDEGALISLARAMGGNVTLILKGPRDRIVTKERSYVCSMQGSLRRCGGQGDILAGALGLFAHWAKLLADEGRKDRPFPLEVTACWAACAVTRTCSRLAVEEKGRSTTTPDMLELIGKAFEHIF